MIGAPPARDRRCRECDAPIASGAPATKTYCHLECQQAAYRRTHPRRWAQGRISEPNTARCPVCGGDPSRYGKYGGVARYCSVRCSADAKNARKRAARKGTHAQ